MKDLSKWFKSKERRHHNNSGLRQIKNGSTFKFVEYLKKKYIKSNT